MFPHGIGEEGALEWRSQKKEVALTSHMSIVHSSHPFGLLFLLFSLFACFLSFSLPFPPVLDSCNPFIFDFPWRISVFYLFFYVDVLLSYSPTDMLTPLSDPGSTGSPQVKSLHLLRTHYSRDLAQLVKHPPSLWLWSWNWSPRSESSTGLPTQWGVYPSLYPSPMPPLSLSLSLK